MVTAIDVQLRSMYDHLDDRYDLGPLRCDPNSDYKDCSGYADMGLNAALAFQHLPLVPCWQADTFQFEALGRARGLFITRDECRRTRGTWAGWNHDGHGHMATSLGDGRTIEARSHALDLGIFTFDGRGWEWYMKPPGLTGFGLPGDWHPGPTTVTEANAMGMTAERVPGTRVQSRAPWLNRYPMVGALTGPDDHQKIIGYNGAAIAGGHPSGVVSVRDLGVLHQPIESLSFVDDDPTAPPRAGHHRCVGLAADGGTFVFDVVVDYI